MSLRLSPNTYIALYGAPGAAVVGATGVAAAAAAATSSPMKLKVEGWLSVLPSIGATDDPVNAPPSWFNTFCSVDMAIPFVVADTPPESRSH